MMYKILVVCALSQELAVVRKQIKNANIPGFAVDFLHPGMGNYNMIFSLTKKLNQKKYDFVVNVGVSGIRNLNGLDTSFYQVSNIFDLQTGKELIVPVFIKFGKLASCISANKVIRSEDLDKFYNIIGMDRNIFLQASSELSSDFYLLDMESYGFEFVMEKFNIPRLILKVPVDTNDKELEKFDYKKALNLLEENIDYKLLLEDIKNFLEKNISKNNENLEKYFKILPFSQRQKEIFEFLYRKYKFVIGEDFDKFFDKFLEENKKEGNKKRVVKKLLLELEKLVYLN